MQRGTTFASHEARSKQVAEERIESLDVLRGFALFGILAVNMAHFASPEIYLSGAQLSTTGAPIDRVVDGLVAFFAQGKFFPLFSFLFGLGLAIQLLSWQGKGASTTPLFVRRLSCLLAIGLVHALFVWAGDILAKYAALGLLFLFVLRLPPAYLLAGAGLLLLIPQVLGKLGIDTYIALLTGLPSNPAEFQALVAQSVSVYGSGSFVEMTQQRLLDYIYRLTAWPYVTGIFTILSMFCLGAYAGRTGLFRPPHTGRFQKLGYLCLAVWATCMSLFALSSVAPSMVPPQVFNIVRLAGNLSMTGLYITGVVLLMESSAWRSRLAPLASTGRMALTNYLLQSVLATSIFYGLGLYGKLGSAACLGITVAIFVVQVLASCYWLERFRFGPIEWLWRWVTYGKRPPMRRVAVTQDPVSLDWRKTG